MSGGCIHTPSHFSDNGRCYTHKICPNRHFAKAKTSRDWTEQDACPRCDEAYDLYDPIRKRTATEDREEKP